ncbi:MAG: hypothetical protein ACK2UH_10205 [Candidatus Promineifilaceae bacterium]
MRMSSIIAGLILILVGLFFLLLPFFPSLADSINIELTWPMIIVGVGGLFLLGALLGSPALAVPGSVIAGIGLLLTYQNANDAWETWGYSWALIPGFVGVGIVIQETLKGRAGKGLRKGGQLIVISLVMFVIAGALIGGLVDFTMAAALILIGLGLWQLIKVLLGRQAAG